MADSESERVLEMVRTFLAASNRGDYAVLFLETRKQQIKAKYRSTEIVTGVPVTTRSPFPKKKVNPARTRRSKLRLEQFLKKKEHEKLENQQAGKAAADGALSSSKPNQLVLQLNEEDIVPEENGPNSPILQIDGNLERDEEQDKEREEEWLDTVNEGLRTYKIAWIC